MKAAKILSIIQLVSMYLIQVLIVVMVMYYSRNAMINTIVAVTIVSVLVSIASAVVGLVQSAKGAGSETKFYCIMKFASVPFFIFNFIIYAGCVMGFMNPFLLLAIPLLILLGVSITYFWMICMSVPLFATVLFPKKRSKTPFTKMEIVALVFQFFFCLDVVGAVMLMKGLMIERTNLC